MGRRRLMQGVIADPAKLPRARPQFYALLRLFAANPFSSAGCPFRISNFEFPISNIRVNGAPHGVRSCSSGDAIALVRQLNTMVRMRNSAVTTIAMIADAVAPNSRTAVRNTKVIAPAMAVSA